MMRMEQVDTTPAMINVSRFLLVLILDMILLMPGMRSSNVGLVHGRQQIQLCNTLTHDASNSLIHSVHDTSLSGYILSCGIGLSIEPHESVAVACCSLNTPPTTHSKTMSVMRCELSMRLRSVK